MRQTQIFAGSSHPELVEKICERLGTNPAEAELGKFSNGETMVQLKTSIRDQDVFIVQSGSRNINDNVMELLIMASACKSGSARTVTAVIPCFFYSRMSKRKGHRGSITARLIANVLHEAGVNHVITIDLHAGQMQGFFHCPVDNLVAEPTLAKWIKDNVRDWRRAVVVSKNPGGTKRVTSLADALKLNFGIVMTDRRRPGSGQGSVNASVIFEQSDRDDNGDAYEEQEATYSRGVNGKSPMEIDMKKSSLLQRRAGHQAEVPMSPLRQAHGANSLSVDESDLDLAMARTVTAPSATRDGDGANDDDNADDEQDDPRSRDVVTGRLIHGHIVDDAVPSPPFKAYSSPHQPQAHSDEEEVIPDHMTASIYSTASSLRPAQTNGNGLGGSGDANASSDDEEENLRNPDLESMVTLVGNVRDRPVFIVDDMIDKSASWIAAAETVVKRGGATAVYCFATHGIFGGDSLQEMEACDCIDKIVVTNTIQIPEEKLASGINSKLRVLDISHLLAEAIRRNHHGESIEQLYLHYD